MSRLHGDIGTVEGTIEFVLPERPCWFSVRTPDGRRIVCMPLPRTNAEAALWVRRAGDRVSVRGTVWATDHGEVVAVEAEEIQPLRSDGPSTSQMQGLVDLTGAIPAEEHVRKLRED